MTEQLKPCPFCGGVVNWCDCGTGCPQITCPKCGQFDLVKVGETLEGAKREAETTWNNRPIEQRLADVENTQDMLSDLVKSAFQEGYYSALDVSSGNGVNEEWKISESLKKLNEIECPVKEDSGREGE